MASLKIRTYFWVGVVICGMAIGFGDESLNVLITKEDPDDPGMETFHGVPRNSEEYHDDEVEVDYEIIDDGELEAKLGEGHRAPANLKGTGETIMPVPLLEYFAAWLHPMPPHHTSKHANRSKLIFNLRNQTFMKELSKNKTLLMKFQARSRELEERKQNKTAKANADKLLNNQTVS